MSSVEISREIYFCEEGKRDIDVATVTRKIDYPGMVDRELVIALTEGYVLRHYRVTSFDINTQCWLASEVTLVNGTWEAAAETQPVPELRGYQTLEGWLLHTMPGYSAKVVRQSRPEN